MKIKHILLFLMAWVSSMNLAYAQQTVVASGSVMDEKGELLIGVSISVKEVPSMGAITDIDGRFKIGGIKAGHTLVISYVGYDPQEIKMNKSDERMRVVLKESSNVMDEVVITASGKVQKKINVTGAITGVEVATLKTPATSISNMLGGRVPGIISVTRSGEPGKDFSEFWVRGISTFGAGQGALVLIDGIEGNLNTLDPEDIESFSILKDASSTAVYGVRGANGVVLVSTKKGKAGKLNLQVKANTGISYSPQMPKYVRAAEYAALANEAAVTRGRIPVYTDVDLALFRNHMDPDFHPDVDWRDVILKDYTWNQQYFLSASGGGEVARYYISAGFTTKDAIFKQDKGVNKYNTNVNYNKFNFRANVDVNVTPTTTLSLNEETVIVTQNYPGYGNDSKVLWQAQSNLTPVTVPLMYTTGQAPGYGTDKSNISPYVLLNMTGYRKFYSNDNKITMQLSTLLLTSDLKGHIESPLSYLQDSRSSSYALDLLMMTQGWRKYNIPEVLKGNITDTLPYNLELGDEVSGKVEGLFSALKEGNISLLALKDSLIGTELAKPDRNGRFVFDRLEYPSGTQYIVQALSKKGSSKVFIELDPYKSFPAPKIGFIPRIEKPHIEENYMAKMDQKYTIENGMRVYNLAEVIVTARRERAVKTESPFYSVGTSKVLTEEDVKKGHFISTYDLLRRLPGITVTNNEVRYRFAPVMVLLDNVPEENFDFDLLDVDDIKDVFYSPATSVGPLYGSAAGNGAIVVTTKNGFVQKNKMNSNIQTIASVGYQQTVEFYSPAYDTKAKKESTTPDLRSTIYWNPSVQVDESGTAHVSFYTADSAADYGIVIEGVCASGNLIYSGEKIVSRHNASY